MWTLLCILALLKIRHGEVVDLEVNHRGKPAMGYEEVHKSPSGPGDARPTALEIVQDQGLVGKLGDKTVLITGATSGLGAETARALCATGAKVFITARHTEKGMQVAKSLTSSGGLPVEVIQMELDSFSSIRAGASAFLSKSRGLDILICSAGVMACPESHTEDGFETQFGVNYLGHFLLFQLLRDVMIKSSSLDRASRTVTLSSSAHRGGAVRLGDYNFKGEPYNAWQAYGQAKTANRYLANEIERRYGDQGIHGLSSHPGFIHTPLERHIADDAMAQQFINNPKAVKIWKSIEQGAATTVWAAIGKEWEGRGRRYLEDVSEAKSFNAEDAWDPLYAAGYAQYAYDAKAAEQLWEDSLGMIAGKYPGTVPPS